MNRTRSVNYAMVTKYGFLLGLGLLVIGGGGELLGHALLGELPAWENALFFDLEVVGTMLMLFVPFVFGIALPLIE